MNFQYFVDDDSDGIFNIASNGSVVVNSGGFKNVNVSVVAIGAKDRKSKKIGRAVISVKIVPQAVNKIEFVDFPESGVDVDLTKREIFRIRSSASNDDNVVFSMTQNDRFKIDSSNGVVYNVGKSVNGNAGGDSTEVVTLDVTVRRLDESDGATRKLKLVVPPLSLKSDPKFASLNVTLSSSASLSETIQLCPQLDSADAATMKIVSGNEDHLFTLDNLNKRLLLARRPR